MSTPTPNGSTADLARRLDAAESDIGRLATAVERQGERIDVLAAEVRANTLALREVALRLNTLSHYVQALVRKP